MVHRSNFLASYKGQDGLSTYPYQKYPARVIKVNKVGSRCPRYLLDLRFSNNGTIAIPIQFNFQSLNFQVPIFNSTQFQLNYRNQVSEIC